MKIAFLDPADASTDALVVAVGAENALSPAAEAADKATGGAISRAIAASRFTGKPRQFLDLLAPNGLSIGRLVLAGLGKPAEANAKAWQDWAGAA